MEIKLNNMCKWERQKAIYLLEVAEGLGMDTSGYGELAVNKNSGYTYLWLEDYSFTLYLPINCELTKKDVMLIWTNSDNGNEEETELNNKSLDDCYKWVEEQEKNAREG